jgi:hypothetical protein
MVAFGLATKLCRASKFKQVRKIASFGFDKKRRFIRTLFAQDCCTGEENCTCGGGGVQENNTAVVLIARFKFLFHAVQ